MGTVGPRRLKKARRPPFGSGFASGFASGFTSGFTFGGLGATSWRALMPRATTPSASSWLFVGPEGAFGLLVERGHHWPWS